MTKADASQMAWVALGTHHLLVQAAGEVTALCTLPGGHRWRATGATATTALWAQRRVGHSQAPSPSRCSARLQPSMSRSSGTQNRDILQVPPLQSQRSLCCPCRVGWCSATFEHQGPAC